MPPASRSILPSESANASGEVLGENRPAAVIEGNRRLKPHDIRDRILQSVREFTGADRLDDDRTLLAIRYVGAAALQMHAA